MVKNPGKENMEIITKEGQKINRYTPSEDQDAKSGKKGRKVGIAYELDNGGNYLCARRLIGELWLIDFFFFNRRGVGCISYSVLRLFLF
mgnify:CR=1 FL=1